MIISDKWKFVFVELPRTGTTSIGDALLNQCGCRRVLFRHAPLVQYVLSATTDQLSYRVIGTMRNPLDRTASLFIKMKNDQHSYYSEKLLSKKGGGGNFYRVLNYWIYTFVSKPNTDYEKYLSRLYYLMPYDDWASLDYKRYNYVIRFENLVEDFEFVMKEVGVQEMPVLPKNNVTKRTQHFLDLYNTDRLRRKAIRIFGPYMLKTGYSFPTDWGDIRVSKYDVWRYEFFHLIRGIYWKWFYKN